MLVNLTNQNAVLVQVVQGFKVNECVAGLKPVQFLHRRAGAAQERKSDLMNPYFEPCHPTKLIES